MDSIIKTTVAIIGAGPSGSVAAALLVKKGYQVVILERSVFPRFSIGESLLPQSMEFLEKAGMFDELAQEPSFQYKDGAAFNNDKLSTVVDFTKKFSKGYGTTYQVRRDKFDKILADKCENLGVKIYYQTEVKEVKQKQECVELKVLSLPDSKYFTIKADFILDASGYGRVLPRLLNLEYPSEFPVRKACFCHIQDNILDKKYDRDKILISVHPEHKDIWYWLIPFADGKASIGVVAREEQLQNSDNDNNEILWRLISEMKHLNHLLKNAEVVSEVQSISGYSANVKSLHGERYALLGNAAEFLDPVFSSGVTIAVKSAYLAVEVLDRQFQGEIVDWEEEFSEPLSKGVEVFKTFVRFWYDGGLQDVIFKQKTSAKIKAMISSILAGYAWDESNPFVTNKARRLQTLIELCRE
ncbi:NAD(P)/FAD-dependent oxidoreductase [Pseudofrancisella aestuarii]|uniref:NAD(P)/FAD-dependent oxidoreductase n=1 Tax=Pseudofrancisella aestuarii TaxID=2670347 RepID=A0ABV9TB24_9GAMM